MKKLKREYKKYDPSFKADVVKQIRQGRSVRELSKTLGVSEGLLYKWKSQDKEKVQDESSELKDLRKQLKSLQEENDILKKALRIFSQHS